jgi:acetyltransferase-like isoleucine patch superfamily enzyme
MKYFSFRYAIFIIRNLILKLKFLKRIRFNSIRVAFEPSCKVSIRGNNSSINFGAVNYFYRYGNLEVFDGGRIVFGNNVSVNKGFSIICRKQIIIGNNVIIGPNVCIYDHDHCFELTDFTFNKQGFKSKTITIGDNVWIGANSFISSGVTIGSDTVIAAGSIVVKDISSKSLAGGNPAKVLKTL